MEEEHVVKVLRIEKVTHDVKRFTLERPEGYNFVPGQATEVSVNKEGLKDKKGPFTFTCLPDSKNLEFTIKIYPEHHALTAELGKLKVGDEVIVRDVWGTIHYKGKGVFIAGGAGVTPFIAILRNLKNEGKIEGNMLIFSNKSFEDIILKDEFKEMLGKNFINTLTRKEKEGYDFGRVDEKYLKSKISDFSQNFYVCGPSKFTEAVKEALKNLGADSEALVFEE